MNQAVAQIRDLGTKLLQQVYRVSRLAAYHDRENEAFSKASSQLCETIRAVNRIEDQSCRILFFHQSILIGTQYLKVYAMGTEVRDSLEQLGVNEIVFEDSTGLEDIADFAALLANPTGSGKSPDELDIGTSIRFRRVNLDIAGSHKSRTKQERLAFQYASAIVVVRRLYDNLKDGKYVMIQQLKRISQGLIELAEDENRLALGVGSMRNLSFDDAGCAVNAAILTIAATRTLTDDRETLSLAAMGAMLADCGRPRVAGMTKGELGKIRAIPRLSDGERLRMAASSAVVLTALGRLHEKSLPRLVLSFEALVAQYAPEANSAFSDGSALGDLSLLISVVWRYINSLRFDVRKQSQRAPELALGALVRHVRSPRETLILKLLTRVLGYLPVGTPVELTEGWVGIVSGGSKVGRSEPLAPSILIVLDPSTHPTDARIVDLSDPANRETYGVVKGVVPAEAHVLLSRKQWEILDGLGKPREAMSAPPVIESISDPDGPDETIDIPIEIVDTQPRPAFETPAVGPSVVASSVHVGGSAAEEPASERSTADHTVIKTRTEQAPQTPDDDPQAERPTDEQRAVKHEKEQQASEDEEDTVFDFLKFQEHPAYGEGSGELTSIEPTMVEPTTVEPTTVEATVVEEASDQVEMEIEPPEENRAEAVETDDLLREYLESSPLEEAAPEALGLAEDGQPAVPRLRDQVLDLLDAYLNDGDVSSGGESDDAEDTADGMPHSTKTSIERYVPSNADTPFKPPGETEPAQTEHADSSVEPDLFEIDSREISALGSPKQSVIDAEDLDQPQVDAREVSALGSPKQSVIGADSDLPEEEETADGMPAYVAQQIDSYYPVAGAIVQESGQFTALEADTRALATTEADRLLERYHKPARVPEPTPAPAVRHRSGDFTSIDEPVTKAVGKAKARSLLEQFLPQEPSTPATPTGIEPEKEPAATVAPDSEELNTRTVTKGEADKLLSAFVPDDPSEVNLADRPTKTSEGDTEFDPGQDENTRTVGRQEADRLLDAFMPEALSGLGAETRVQAEEVTLTVDQSTADTLLQDFVSPNASEIVGSNPFSKGIHEQVTKRQAVPPPPPKQPASRSKQPPPPPTHPANSFAGGRQDGDLTPTGLAFDLTMPPLPTLDTPNLSEAPDSPSQRETTSSSDTVAEEMFELSTEVMAKGTADRLVARFELEPPSTEQLGDASSKAVPADASSKAVPADATPMVGEALRIPAVETAAEEVWGFDSSLSTDARPKESADQLTEKFVEPDDSAAPPTQPPKFAVLKRKHRKKRSR